MYADVRAIFADALKEPAHDRRLTHRFTALWSQSARGGYPSWAEFRTADLGADWNWVFAVDVKRSQGFPYFIFLGSRLARLSDVYLSGDEDWTMSLLDRAAAEVDACIAARAPIQRDARLILYSGERILFRSVTAPLSENGADISHVCGVASGRPV